jgi:two-component system, LytTR family, response regulator LytT
MRFLIVEDDVLIAEHLREIIEEKGQDVVDLVGSVASALEKINGGDVFDLVLLDINMEHPEAGIQLAEKLKGEYVIPFIFITAQSDASIIKKAALTQPLAYIVKPFVPVSVLVSIEMAREKIGSSKLVFRDGYKEIVIPSESIVYGKSSNNYIEIFGVSKKWVIRFTMKELMDYLSEKHFMQIHRSYFINVNFLESVTTNKVCVRGNILPISKAFEAEIKEVLK